MISKYVPQLPLSIVYNYECFFLVDTVVRYCHYWTLFPGCDRKNVYVEIKFGFCFKRTKNTAIQHCKHIGIEVSTLVAINADALRSNPVTTWLGDR